MAEEPRPPLIVDATHKLLQHNVYQSLHGSILINTFYTRVPQFSYTSWTLSSFASDFWDFIKTSWIACASGELSFFKIRTAVMGHPEVLPEEFLITPNEVGSVGGESLPSTNAVVITVKSRFGGKRGRGRKYIAGVGESLSQNSVLTAGGLVLFDALAAKLVGTQDPVGGLGLGQQAWLYSRNKDGEVGVAGAEVTSTRTNEIFGTQRSRRKGVGI